MKLAPRPDAALSVTFGLPSVAPTFSGALAFVLWLLWFAGRLTVPSAKKLSSSSMLGTTTLGWSSCGGWNWTAVLAACCCGCCSVYVVSGVSSTFDVNSLGGGMWKGAKYGNGWPG